MMIFNKIVKTIVKLSVSILGKFVSSSETVIIGCNNGRYFVDNCKYFFEYYYDRNLLNIKILTRNKSLYNFLSKKYPNSVLYAWSLKALFAFVKTKVIIISHGDYDVFPYPLNNKNKHIINLWHGIALKKIGYMNTPKVNREFEKLAESIEYFVVSSEFEKQFIMECFHLNDNNIWLTGTPRNDIILEDNSELITQHPFLKEKIILYAPTFRDNGVDVQYFPFSDFNIEELNSFLEKNNSFLLIRGHINTHINQDFNIESKTRIRLANQNIFPEVQELLSHVDIIITDYSSIYIDYLLLDRPIIFLPYDLEKYIAERGFIYDYHKHTPGPKVNNKKAFYEHLQNYLDHPETDSEWRLEICNKFHMYKDGKACERVYNRINEFCG